MEQDGGWCEIKTVHERVTGSLCCTAEIDRTRPISEHRKFFKKRLLKIKVTVVAHQKIQTKGEAKSPEMPDLPTGLHAPCEERPRTVGRAKGFWISCGWSTALVGRGSNPCPDENSRVSKLRTRFPLYQLSITWEPVKHSVHLQHKTPLGPGAWGRGPSLPCSVCPRLPERETELPNRACTAITERGGRKGGRLLPQNFLSPNHKEPDNIKTQRTLSYKKTPACGVHRGSQEEMYIKESWGWCYRQYREDRMARVSGEDLGPKDANSFHSEIVSNQCDFFHALSSKYDHTECPLRFAQREKSTSQQHLLS